MLLAACLDGRVNRCLLVLAVVLFGACAGPPGPLTVKQFQLRDLADSNAEDPMVRNEKLRRIHGAVSVAERRQRLGQYYTVLWRDPAGDAGAGDGPRDIIFEYQQGATASLVKRMSRRFDAGQTSGVAEFAVIGDDYFTNGRVLAWRVSFLRDGRVVATKQSYLWQS
jgi:hypothetical protein